jgi:hypothetical protein
MSMGRDHRETFVELPETVGAEFEVFVNGVAQRQGQDFELRGRTLVFPRPIPQEGKIPVRRWMTMWLAGVYRKHESIDIVYDHNGRRIVAANLGPLTFPNRHS